jgi:Zn-dependent protease
VIAVFEFVLLLFSISVHECAHAWMASRLGDQTARMMGRVSLNPIDHIDPIGTLIFPALMIFGPFFGLGFGGMLVGWAKPTPVITRNFRNFVRDTTLVSLAGPASNLLIAVLAFFGMAFLAITQHRSPVMEYPSSDSHFLVIFLNLALLINLSLCIFNLIPIPPLDGSRVLRNFLPYGAAQVYDRINNWISYLLIITVGRAIMGMLLYPILGLFYSALARL